MKILGIDPGYAILGYGVVEKIGNKFKVCDYGAITTDAGTPMTERTWSIFMTRCGRSSMKSSAGRGVD